MSHDSDAATRLARLERRTRALSLGLFLMAAAATLGFVTGGRGAAATTPSADVITARGLVIVDAANRPRIVIGAPVAAALRDERLAATVGLVVLDTANRLNVAVGQNPPLILEDGTAGHRIASSNGLVFYDPRDGKERGGLGAFADGRATVCLDYGNAQKEAACMAVAPDDQYAAVLLNGTPREQAYDRVGMFLGADGVGVLKAFGGVNSQDGVMIRAGGGLPRITVYDSAQSEVADLVERELGP